MSKKSILLSIITAILIIPQIAFAAWWNPLSWFNNWRFSPPAKEIRTEELESRIKELEEKLENVATSTPVIIATTTQPNPGSIEKKTEKPKTTSQPTVQKPVQAVTQPTTPKVELMVKKDYESLYKNTYQKYADLRTLVREEKMVLDEYTSLTIVKSNRRVYLNKLLGILTDDMKTFGEIRDTKPKPENTVNYYVSKYNQIEAEFSAKTTAYKTDTIEEQVNATRNTGTIEAEKRKSSPECLTAKTAYEEIESKINNVKRSYASKIRAVDGSGLTDVQRVAQTAQLERQQATELADLSVEANFIMSKYYAVCEGYYGSPKPLYPAYTPPVNTYCSQYGNNVNCTSY